ncbi:hypothetical protein ACF0H5_016383 [Mactra antiquata]
MASTATNGRGKLPPLNPSASTEEGDKPKKKKVVKKKKPAEDAADETGEQKPKAAARRKKAASANSNTETGGESTTPKKKKRAPKKTETQQDGDPTSARSGGSQGEDVSGSKASLIKSPKEGTPRKKKAKKKVKKTPETAEGGGEEETFGSTLLAELTDIQDDIITHDEDKDKDEEEDQYRKQPYSTTSIGIRSQPTEKFYIETDGGFKGENKNKFAKRQAEELKDKAVVVEEPKNTTIEFAIRTHAVLRTFSLFCHGLLAGLALWHIVVSYILMDFGDYDFIEHYRELALPVQCVFYLLIALCTLSCLDRFDIAHSRRGFVLKALTLQNGTVSVLIYFAALVVSLSNGAIEDKINLYDIKPSLWNNTATASDDLDLWLNLNTTRNILSIIGWFVISLTPLTDRLTENLRQTDDDDLLGVEVETGKTALA